MMTMHATLTQDTQAVSTAVMAPQLGLAKGTVVATLDGMSKVEDLRSGARIVTRSGARKLVDLHRNGSAYALAFNKPEVVYLADGQVHSDTYLPFAA